MRHLSLHACGCRQDTTRKLMADAKEEGKKHKDECAYPKLYMHGKCATAQAKCGETTGERETVSEVAALQLVEKSAASPARSCSTAL